MFTSNRRHKLSQFEVKVTVLGQRSENTVTCRNLSDDFFVNLNETWSSSKIFHTYVYVNEIKMRC